MQAIDWTKVKPGTKIRRINETWGDFRVGEIFIFDKYLPNYFNGTLYVRGNAKGLKAVNFELVDTTPKGFKAFVRKVDAI